MVARVIAIDGPAASGKSSVAARLAEALSIPYVSTGSMYRAVAWVADSLGVNGNSSQGIVDMLSKITLDYVKNDESGYTLCVNGKYLKDELRSAKISLLASQIAVIPEVREFLKSIQRDLAGKGWIVMEGRDIGSVVFPDAAIKFYLTASALERAKRRMAQEGAGATLEEVAAGIEARDIQDSTRKIAPLIIAEGAQVVDSSGMSLDESVKRILNLTCRHEFKYRVSYGDTDQMGVVYYANYFEFFERGRTEMLRNVDLPYRKLESQGIFFPVVEAKCRYLRPARYDDLLTIRTQVVEAKGARLTISSEVYRDDELLVEGEITLCCVDGNRKTSRLPTELLSACSIYRKAQE